MPSPMLLWGEWQRQIAYAEGYVEGRPGNSPDWWRDLQPAKSDPNVTFLRDWVPGKPS